MIMLSPKPYDPNLLAYTFRRNSVLDSFGLQELCVVGEVRGPHPIKRIILDRSESAYFLFAEILSPRGIYLHQLQHSKMEEVPLPLPEADLQVPNGTCPSSLEVS